MFVKHIVLCVCAVTLTAAAPIIQSDKTIESASDISAKAKEIEASELQIPMSPDRLHQLEGMIIPTSLDKMEVRGSDWVKIRVRRDIFRVKCPVGETKIGGICMSCEEMGTCK